VAFGLRSGLPVLLNTSFNERSMPIVATAVEALLTFLRTGIDVLVAEDLIVSKVNRHL
jgi:carbamoyltransferase